MADDRSKSSDNLGDTGQWTRTELKRIVQEACREQLQEHQPVIDWAKVKMDEERVRRERGEKIKTTILGQGIIWVIITLLYTTGSGALIWARKVLGISAS